MNAHVATQTGLVDGIARQKQADWEKKKQKKVFLMKSPGNDQKQTLTGNQSEFDWRRSELTKNLLKRDLILVTFDNKSKLT